MKVGGRSIKTRDWAMVRIIQGVTKSGVHQDRKKELDRMGCRDYDAHLEAEEDSTCQGVDEEE